MIELERHIEILLLSNDCVIVPEFGGFMAHHVDARYDEEDGSFVPPLRTLGFNPQLTMNDSLLVQSYIEAYDVSYPEALKRIEGEVAELKQHLDNNGFYEMDDLGMLHLNQNGKLEFTPCEAGILTPVFYGLSSFEFNLLEEAEERHSNIPATVQGLHVDTPLSTEESITDVENGDEEREKSISIPLRVVRYAAAACIAAIAFLLMPSSLGNQESSMVSKGNIDTSLLYRIMPKDITTGKPSLSSLPRQSVTSPKADSLPEKKAVEPQEETQQPAAQPAYTIVLASKVSKANAALYVEQLHKSGLADARVATHHQTTRVIYGTYASEAEAYKALNQQAGKHTEFADSWVLKLQQQ